MTSQNAFESFCVTNVQQRGFTLHKRTNATTYIQIETVEQRVLVFGVLLVKTPRQFSAGRIARLKQESDEGVAGRVDHRELNGHPIASLHLVAADRHSKRGRRRLRADPVLRHSVAAGALGRAHREGVHHRRV